MVVLQQEGGEEEYTSITTSRVVQTAVNPSGFSTMGGDGWDWKKTQVFHWASHLSRVLVKLFQQQLQEEQLLQLPE